MYRFLYCKEENILDTCMPCSFIICFWCRSAALDSGRGACDQLRLGLGSEPGLHRDALLSAALARHAARLRARPAGPRHHTLRCARQGLSLMTCPWRHLRHLTRPVQGPRSWPLDSRITGYRRIVIRLSGIISLNKGLLVCFLDRSLNSYDSWSMSIRLFWLTHKAYSRKTYIISVSQS